MRGKLVAFACVALAGCATIVQGSNQNVSVSSMPTGAQVTIDGKNMGVTPMVAQLARKQSHKVQISMAGYQPYEIEMTKGVSGWVAGNLLFGGIPGLVIDAITGSMYKLSPDSINGELGQASAMTGPRDQIMVRVVLAADPSWEKIGQLTPVATLGQ
ncbi:MAG: PEGA domain-containing protein [Gemmatimonadetes bacterium]|nr:PEGA domain-containing protein [Gemmatimonadota bacterium]